MSADGSGRGPSPDVLTVEDDPDIALTLGLRLRMNGYHVRHAGDGDSALRAVRERRPDLIIMDVTLPGADGFEVAARINEESDLADVPVVFLTASMRPDMEERASGAGAAAFLRKPYQGAQLLACVERLTGGAEE